MNEELVGKILNDNKNSGKVCSRPRKIGDAYTRCWSRDFATCPSCAGLNALYTKKLIGSGFEEKDSRFFFLTLTAPSFGKVHSVPHSPTDAVRTCSCGEAHVFGSPLGGVPLDMRRYKFRDSVRWNHASTELFRRTMSYLADELPESAWSAVREFQNRGSIHLHVIVRVPDSYDVQEVFATLSKANTYKFGEYKWGKKSDVQLIQTAGAENTVRYLSKLIGYATKTLGKSRDFLSDEQRTFYGKLDAASVRLDYSPKATRGFGYGGQVFTKSGDWSDLTKAKLVEDARSYAEQNGDSLQTDQKSLVAEQNTGELRELAARLGNLEQFIPPVGAPSAIRDRIRGTVSGRQSVSLSEPLSSEELDLLLDELNSMDFLAD